MNAKDRRALAFLEADEAAWVLIGPERIATVTRRELEPCDVWPTGVYWSVHYTSRKGPEHGGGMGGYDTEPEAVAYAEQLTGVDAVAQGVLALEASLNS